MELPRRAKGDQYTPVGRYRDLESQIRRRVRGQNHPVLFIYAFDPRTRLGPFVYADRNLIPGSPRAVGSALYAAGFTQTRLVHQPWAPNLRPSEALLGGRPPEILMVSAMLLHSAAAYNLIRDAWTLGDDRPLILAGGAKAIYEPWDYFGLSDDGSVGADAVVTGEEFVLLELLDRILEHKGSRETMRQGFERVRASGQLEDIPGLVYRPDAPEGPPPYLVNTGIQRLVQDLDELPLPFDALELFEPPHRRTTLSDRPLPAAEFGRHARIMCVVATHGCKFHCPYCPIPGYNQRTFRYRSPQRLTEEIAGMAERTGIRTYFGTDDNFFNNRQTVQETFAAMAKGKVRGKPFRDAIWFATEGTEYDVHKNQDLLPLGREGGLRAIWFGIEDLTAELVKKGQSPEKTKEVFKVLRKNGIDPMPMMMHHDGQPLWTARGLAGLLNQVRFLWRQGAGSCQITLLTPSVGSKSYEDTFRDGRSLRTVAGKPVEDYQFDGNHCVATEHAKPWKRQWNMLLAYLAFYNPVHFVEALFRFDKLWAERLIFQALGMVGLGKSIYNLRHWLLRLARGPIERTTELPPPRFRMVVPGGVDPQLTHYGFAEPLPVLDAPVDEPCAAPEGR